MAGQATGGCSLAVAPLLARRLLLLLLASVVTTAESALAFTRSPPRSWTPTQQLATTFAAPSSLLLSSSRKTAAQTSALLASTAATEEPPSTADETSSEGPELGKDGIYHCLTKADHQALLTAHPDKLIILKVYAPWCRACKGLEPKFLSVARSPKYNDRIPIIWADLSVAGNKAFVQSLGVLALPTVQFYVAGQISDTFACGPSKMPILKRKLAALINANVDAKTRLLKDEVLQAATAVVDAEPATAASTDTETPATAKIAAETKPQQVKEPEEGESGQYMTPEERRKLIEVVPYFQELSLADLDAVLNRAKLLTFETGSIIMREGNPGRTFFIMQSGEVEICQKATVDPLATPASYLGTVINRLGPYNYFGERALITGEPRAASIRVSERVKCWAFDKDDFPASSVLSGRTRDVSLVEQVNDKYGVSLPDLLGQVVASEVVKSTSKASQVRGSVNTPQIIRGVDTEDDVEMEDEDAASVVRLSPTAQNNDEIFNLLNRFRKIRHATRCFRYIVKTKAQWGDQGIRARRNMLVQRLTPVQRQECMETFQLIDRSNDGYISLEELKQVMQISGGVIGASEDDDDIAAATELPATTGGDDDEFLEQIISKGHDDAAATAQKRSPPKDERFLTQQDFMGIWAEAEFYHLFRDIFASLDGDDTGFVKASDLDRVLCGIRGLISDDPKSIIDVGEGDEDMLIDYEQFSRMLLGSALV